VGRREGKRRDETGREGREVKGGERKGREGRDGREEEGIEGKREKEGENG